MNAIAIIDEIRRQGGTLQLQGKDIILSAAQPLPRELVTKVRQHKREILSALKDSGELAIEFGRTGRIRIESDWAGPVWLVFSDEKLHGDEDGSVYFPNEIPFLVNLSPREPHFVHGFKRHFGGTIDVSPWDETR
jgi:hypothetical protein